MNLRRFFGALRRRRDLSDVLAERIAAEPTPPGVPYLYVDTVTGGHDSYPHMSDQARDVCTGYLDQIWALPARERA